MMASLPLLSAQIFVTCLLSSALSAEIDCSISTCLAEDAAPEEGHYALLQEKQIRTYEVQNGAAGRWLPDTSDDIFGAPGMQRTLGPGSTEQLSQAGYEVVAAICCNYEMAQFAKRIIQDLGLVICDSDLVAGILPWYTCHTSTTKGRRSCYADLRADLNASQPPAHCASVASSLAACPAFNQSCAGHVNLTQFGDCDASKVLQVA
mmetsp:Transcript_4426/g.7428  ORF Transcript_4426/g.7428 Transcript_4426/m.7428 type:complete len:206 (-) Transcript_4426:150-767(-)